MIQKAETDTSKTGFISKLVEEIDALGVFGKTKITDIVQSSGG